jgi:ATP-dependent 26S proteasome regulatory subunit
MNLDEAFLRRMHFVIDFPMPEEPYRLRIWQGTVPPEMPLAGDVDFGFLARQFRISGGNIRNIVLAAAFLAASDGDEVSMRHFIRGTRREFQKLGRMVTEADFGEHIVYLE